MRSLNCLCYSSQFELLLLGYLAQFHGSLLCLGAVIVHRPHSLDLSVVFPLSVSLQLSQSLDLILFLQLFLLEFACFVLQVVDFLSHLVTLVLFDRHIPLCGSDLHVFPVDLVPVSADLLLVISVLPRLFVQQEPQVIDFLLQTHCCGPVGLLLRAIVVVLKQLLVLLMTVLGLDIVQLVPQSQVVLVALLNLEDLGFQLGDQQVFLVGGKVHTVIVLHEM